MKKKIIAVLLSACMLVSACPTGAFAMSDEETNTYAATGDVEQGGTSVVDETSAPEATEAPEQTPTPAPEETSTPAPAETPAPVEVKAQATPAANAEEAAPAKQSAETGIATTMLLPDDDKKPAVDTYRFYDADGTELTEWQQTVAAGEKLLEPTAPKKDNARFVGWYDKSDNLFEGFGEITSVTGGATVKLTAKFEDVRYVYFMNKDGSSVCYTAEGEAETAVNSSDLEAAKNTVNLMLDAESHVVGWSTVPNGEATTVTFAKDEIVTKVYPVIESGFWVKFDTNGGSHVQSVFCEPGKTLTLSQAPTRSGYTFDGWYIGEEKVESVSASATVTAHWTASNNTKYTVIHWLENADDDEYTLDGTETKTGTTGSETNAAAKSYTGFTAQAITQETIAGDGSTIVNVYYKRNVYEVKFMKRTCNKEEHTHSFLCGLWCDKEEHQHSENCYTEITGLTIRAKHGANISDKWPTYQGSNTWAVNPTGGPYQVNIDTMPMGGDTFYGPKTGQGSETAYYFVEALPGASNTVTVGGIKYVLHHSDTSPGTGYTVTQEDKYSITGFKYSRGTQNGSSYNGAKFYYTRESYNITFINNGSTDDTKNFKYEASIADAYYVPNRPSEIDASYTFAGWYDNKLCEGEPFVFTGKTMPAKGITLYAKWQAPQVNATVYLSASADSEPETFSVPYGKKITESEDFNAIIARIKEETGEAPSAWFVVTGEGRVLFDLDTPLYSSVTLYPFFASSSEGYTVTYKEEGTDEPAKDEQKYLTGSRAGILAPVNGENFRAWETEDGTLIHPGDKITVTKNTTLRAVYTIKPQTETITYHYNFTDKDGNYNDATFNDGNHPKNTNAKVLTLSAAGFELVAGYEFLGWALTANGSITYQPGDEAFVDGNDDNDLWAVWTRKLYTVKWLDEDGSVLDTEEYEYNAVPSYKKGTPTKASTEDTVYTFDGWNPEIVPVTESTEYVATYKDSVRKYTVKWLDEDGSVLDTEEYEYNAVPSYKKGTPTKASTEDTVYTFDGWNPEIVPVTESTEYVATYKDSVRKYTVKWLDEDDSVLDTEEYEYNAVPSYKKGTPTKASTEDTVYTFDGWNPEIVPVTESTEYVATYKDSVRKYTVKWLDEDGSVLDTEEYEYNAVPSYKKGTPTKASTEDTVYTFDGWNPEIVPVTESTEYVATYKDSVRKYTVKWLDEDDSVLDTEEYEYNAVPSYKKGTPTKASTEDTVYTFDGWNPEIVPVTESTEYVATYKDSVRKYTVKWLDEDGSVLDTEEYEYNAVPSYKKGTPTKASTEDTVYTFDGWNPEIVPVTESTEYVATYKDSVRKYTVKWLDEDGSVLDTEEYEYNAVPSYKKGTPTKASTEDTVYTFDGWNPEIVPVTESTEYVATYKDSVRKYTVKWLDEDGSVLDTEEYEYNAVPSYKKGTPTKASTEDTVYTFDGWNPEIVPVTESTEYVATYKDSVRKYTVKWLDEDGSVLDTEEYEYNAVPSYKKGTPTKASTEDTVYTFDGWNPEIVPVTESTEYVATYKDSVRKYTVKWLDEDGSVLDTEEYEYNAVPSYKKGTPTKASTEDTVYTFDGWNPEIVPVTESTEYVATYKDSARKYTVKWLDEDGSLLREDTVEYGTMPNYGANPTKAADAQYTYTFKSWTPEVKAVTGNATYQATYTKEANSYTLTYDLDGGEWENDTTYTYTKKYNEEVEVKADPTKTGYTFAGWTSEEVEVVNDKFTMPAKNVTLKAQWEANTYKVTYELAGGEWTEATNEFPYEYKATVEVIKTIPTREGYKFSGWRSEEVTIENDAFTMPAKDVVLKAVWEANPTPTPIPSEEPTPTPTPTPAPTEEPTPTPAPTAEPTSEPTATPTATPTAEPTAEPTTEPTATPTAAPTATPAPNPNPATPTPAPVTPVVPATVATPTPTPTATPSAAPTATPSDNGGKGDGNNDGEIGETINDNETPLTNGEDIADNATPLAGLGTGAWALINLILTIVTTLLSILLLIGYIGKKKKALEDEDGNVVLDENGKEVMEYEKNKKGLWRLISIIPALIAIIVFIFTEDMTLPMIFVDKWTILHVVIALVQVVVMVLCKKKKDENDEDENAANA